MIDTISISVPMSRVLPPGIPCDGKREWEGWRMKTNGRGYTVYVRDEPEYTTPVYLPRLTGYRQRNPVAGWESKIKIEFSVPKLVFGNNLDEVDDMYLEYVADTLSDRLGMMGLAVSGRHLKEASVLSVHYSKNLFLPEGYTARYVIGKLRKICADRRMMQMNTSYTGDGDMMSLYNRSHSFEFYDKIAEMDKDRSVILPQDLSGAENILRIEVRLYKKRKMNAVFRGLGYGDNPSFRDVLSSEKSKRVLLHYWGNIIMRDETVLFSAPVLPRDILASVLASYQDIKPKQAIYNVGLLILCRDEEGMGHLRATLLPICSSRSWYRIVTGARRLKDDMVHLSPESWYSQINNDLMEFNPIRVIAKK
jgi:hypothetical protein